MAIDPSEKTGRLGLRDTFDQQALRYNRARRGYPDEIFDRIGEAGDLTAVSRVLEIGPGTGQATRSMAARGWQVTGIELGSALADVGRAELAHFDNIEIVSGDVETLALQPKSFDAVTAFTCFHWLDPDTRVGRAASLLKTDGLVAVVDTFHVAGGSADFFVEAQACYARWTEADSNVALRSPDAVEPRLGFLVHENLEPLSEHRAERDISYSTAE